MTPIDRIKKAIEEWKLLSVGDNEIAKLSRIKLETYNHVLKIIEEPYNELLEAAKDIADHGIPNQADDIICPYCGAYDGCDDGCEWQQLKATIARAKGEKE